ncbi:methyltransferase, TIGR04325 family [Rhodomicrobium sp. Az07]|uniref:methyltransferase, TIGR04325 family n=1 Tax=Rhodomicrobium sp. Az07 TaxID=2839034 RepID=UPI001BE87B8F|nr:methyltransferase, TIGR04325 family [Rhodomicrobium sp. Az07]MBT3069776.1 methyltransferase, TIGR04325 family [Rhodomicrobium sp. Az07]
MITAAGKQFFKSITPPILVDIARDWRRAPAGAGGFEGPFGDWNAAVANSTGWDAPVITEKTRDISRAVRDGNIRFQQDTIARNSVVYSSAILAFLVMAIQESNGAVDILDFGGSLGTNYIQNRAIIANAVSEHRCNWVIVERPDIVRIGRDEFERDGVRFFETLDEASATLGRLPASVLFSGSLQYLDAPMSIIDRLVASDVRIIGIDRLLMSEQPEHEIFVQRPDPEKYYSASYPVWAISRKRFAEEMSSRGYALIAEFPQSMAGPFRHYGMMFSANRQ